MLFKIVFNCIFLFQNEPPYYAKCRRKKNQLYKHGKKFKTFSHLFSVIYVFYTNPFGIKYLDH